MGGGGSAAGREADSRLRTAGRLRLTDAWRLGPSEVVVLVGGGGKTSLMEALARDYEAEGARVVLTTTTKVRPPGPGGRPLVLAETLDMLMGRLAGDSALPGSRGPLIGRRLLPEDKVEGIPPEWVAHLRDAPGVDAVVVEADGSAGRPLKAPAAWEPVMPPCASLVVAVAGLDAQGAPLDESHVHRPELVAGLMALDLGAPLPPAALVEVLTRGYQSRVPPGAAFRVFLNKIDRFPIGSGLAEACARSPLEVWAGAVGSGEAASLCRLSGAEARPGAIVLAAGRGTRMGGPKLLARLDGPPSSSPVEPLLPESPPLQATHTRNTVLGHVLDAVVGCRERLAEIVVVTGRGSEDVAAALGDLLVAINPDPEVGQSGSLQVGVGALPNDRDVLVILGDQPFVNAETLGRVLDARAAAPRAAAVGLLPEGGPRVRPPVVLHRSLLPRILELDGDQGARELIERYQDQVVPVVGTHREGLDVDTPAALELARLLIGR